MFVSDDSQGLCGCGNTGDVEALVAGSALARGLAPAGFADAAALFAAVYSGNPWAAAIAESLCRTMGRMLYNLVATLDLQRISLAKRSGTTGNSCCRGCRRRSTAGSPHSHRGANWSRPDWGPAWAISAPWPSRPEGHNPPPR